MNIQDNLYRTMFKVLNRRLLKPYYEKLRAIKHMQLTNWSDTQLQDMTIILKHKVSMGAPQEDWIIEAAALVNEVVYRLMRIRLYDPQIIAGLALLDGYLVDMQTGEGKTLAAVLPAYVSGLTGNDTHIFTFNDYLAIRDASWMGPLYQFLGLTVGYITETSSLEERQAAYAADVTYLTARQACFDYLKDSLVYNPAHRVQRSLHNVIVDEADSILIDEARIPLVIAGDTGEARGSRRPMTDIVKQLLAGIDYDKDDNERNVYLTERGADKAELLLGCGNLYELENTAVLAELNCTLHAEVLLKKNIHYIVRQGTIQLIDEFTGRIADKRHYPDGLQTAVEVKEGVKVQPAGRILGSMTLQHFLGLYQNICGMTATAESSADEFSDVYALDVLVIPPNKPCRRIDNSHLIFSDFESKQRALIHEIAAVHATGRPILVGTGSVEESNGLAAALVNKGVTCQVLNAQQDALEAEVISKAGKLGSVTVSTNMAGRGVDIILGAGDPEEYIKVAALGGLYVIGTRLHESIRVDQQLRGRAGRQGDPGSSRFYISLEDELLVKHGVRDELPEEYLESTQDAAIDDPRLRHMINHIQLVIEGQNYEIKKTLNKYANLLEHQRRIIYKRREDLLFNRTQPNMLKSSTPEIHQRLCMNSGEEKVTEAEKIVTLAKIDKCWSDHLEYVTYIKESIHLESLSNKNPLDEYNRMIIQAFDRLKDTIKDEVLEVFRKTDTADGIISLDMSEVKTPSATWTYMINDSFFQNRVNLF